MIINVAKVRKAFGSTEVFEFSEPLENIDLADSVVEFTQVVEVQVKATNLGHSILLQGEIKTKCRLACSRCLEGYELDVDTGFSEELCHVTEVGAYLADHPEAEEEENYSVFSTDEIDLKPLVSEHVVLALPMKPLCSEDCQGLCAQCGSNLNLKKCGCKPNEIDPRLEGLAKFFKKQ
ncbi:MAG TPA: DUF177 domain-containing protein [Verrucomicrobiae bacterium]|nr:DUF177 domain-containing protein [Verrucomicrobiae bacterium]